MSYKTCVLFTAGYQANGDIVGAEFGEGISLIAGGAKAQAQLPLIVGPPREHLCELLVLLCLDIIFVKARISSYGASRPGSQTLMPCHNRVMLMLWIVVTSSVCTN